MEEIVKSKTEVCSVRTIIRGRVQGVGFRAWVMQQARERGLSGWVRNCSDGSVEAVFCGTTEKVEKMLEDCWDGPMISRVLSIDTTPCKDVIEAGFTRRANAEI